MAVEAVAAAVNGAAAAVVESLLMQPEEGIFPCCCCLVVLCCVGWMQPLSPLNTHVQVELRTIVRDIRRKSPSDCAESNSA